MMTEEQLAQIEAGAVRLPIGAKDRKGVDICLGDSVHFADAAEWGSTETPMWTVRMEGGKLPQPGSPSDLVRFCEVVETDGVDPAAIVAEIRRLQAENTALRARAVPALEWHKSPAKRELHHANVGLVQLSAWRNLDGEHSWCIAHGHGFEEDIADGDAASMDDAKAKCEAAFLWLVGVK